MHTLTLMQKGDFTKTCNTRSPKRAEWIANTFLTDVKSN